MDFIVLSIAVTCLGSSIVSLPSPLRNFPRNFPPNAVAKRSALDLASTGTDKSDFRTKSTGSNKKREASSLADGINKRDVATKSDESQSGADISNFFSGGVEKGYMWGGASLNKREAGLARIDTIPEDFMVRVAQRRVKRNVGEVKISKNVRSEFDQKGIAKRESDTMKTNANDEHLLKLVGGFDVVDSGKNEAKENNFVHLNDIIEDPEFLPKDHDSMAIESHNPNHAEGSTSEGETIRKIEKSKSIDTHNRKFMSDYSDFPTENAKVYSGPTMTNMGNQFPSQPNQIYPHNVPQNFGQNFNPNANPFSGHPGGQPFLVGAISGGGSLNQFPPQYPGFGRQPLLAPSAPFHQNGLNVMNGHPGFSAPRFRTPNRFYENFPATNLGYQGAQFSGMHQNGLGPSGNQIGFGARMGGQKGFGHNGQESQYQGNLQ